MRAIEKEVMLPWLSGYERAFVHVHVYQRKRVRVRS